MQTNLLVKGEDPNLVKVNGIGFIIRYTNILDIRVTLKIKDQKFHLTT